MAVEHHDEFGRSPASLMPEVHWLTLSEIRSRFVTNPHRAWLYAGFVEACKTLREHGCRAVYLGGSFVEEKEYPGDYDAVFDTVGVSSQVDPALFDPDRAEECKQSYRGDWLFGRSRSWSGRGMDPVLI